MTTPLLFLLHAGRLWLRVDADKFRAPVQGSGLSLGGRALTPGPFSPQSRSGAVPGGIPYRRANRPRPSPELSEEEAKRIARIFSAQLSKKE